VLLADTSSEQTAAIKQIQLLAPRQYLSTDNCLDANREAGTQFSQILEASYKCWRLTHDFLHQKNIDTE